jgi:galactokinase
MWEARFASQLPEQLAGGAFLARYGSLTDPVTRVQPERIYPVRAATAHPIYEHARVERFRTLLLAGDTTNDGLAQLGELMYESHASYSACGLGTAGTDRLVALVRAAGPARGLYGAKITGGGSGGTVAVLARHGCKHHVLAIARQYERETGRPALVLGGSSPGAAAFGVHRLVPGPR